MCQFCDVIGAQVVGHGVQSEFGHLEDASGGLENIKFPEVLATPKSAGPNLPFDTKWAYEVYSEAFNRAMRDRAGANVYFDGGSMLASDRIRTFLTDCDIHSRSLSLTREQGYDAWATVNAQYLVDRVAWAIRREKPDLFHKTIDYHGIIKAFEAENRGMASWLSYSDRMPKMLMAADRVPTAWAVRHALAWNINMYMAIAYNMSQPDDKKLCLQCVGEWQDGAECVGSKVDCGHVIFNPRYVDRRPNLLVPGGCLSCGGTLLRVAPACAECAAGHTRTNNDLCRVLGSTAACTRCCRHRSCDRCHNQYDAGHDAHEANHCNACCDCPMCPNCGSKDANKCLNNAKHCVNCCACKHEQPVHTRNDDMWQPNGWQVKPFVPDAKELKRNRLARILGAELEVAGMYSISKDFYDVCTKKWKARIMSDGSLPTWGFEMPTQPAGGDLWLDMVTEITDVLARSKAYVNWQCGTHLHVDTRDLSADELYRVIQLYAVVENALYSVAHPMRSKGDYAAKCGPTLLQQFSSMSKMESGVTMEAMELMFYKGIKVRTNPDGKLEADDGIGWLPLGGRNTSSSIIQAKNDIARVKEGKGFSHRYRGLNLHSHFHRGSIEFRIHHGTIKGETIINWGLTVGSVVQWAKDHSTVQLKKMLIDTDSDSMKTLARVAVEVTGKNEMVDWLTMRAAAMKKLVGQTRFTGEQ